MPLIGWYCLHCCFQMALQPVMDEVDTKVPYTLLQAISVGLGDVVSDMLQKLLDNVSHN